MSRIITKWYTHKPESFLEDETHKILNDFEIQIYHLILARIPDLIIINKNKKKKKERPSRWEDFAVPADHKEKIKENKTRDKYFYLTT